MKRARGIPLRARSGKLLNHGREEEDETEANRQIIEKDTQARCQRKKLKQTREEKGGSTACRS